MRRPSLREYVVIAALTWSGMCVDDVYAYREISLSGGPAIPMPSDQYSSVQDLKNGLAAQVGIAFAPSAETNRWLDLVGALEFARLDIEEYQWRDPSNDSFAEWESRSGGTIDMWDLTMSVRFSFLGNRQALFSPYGLFGVGLHWEDQSLIVNMSDFGSGEEVYTRNYPPNEGASMLVGLGFRVGSKTAFLAQARCIIVVTGSTYYHDIRHAKIEIGMSTRLD